MIAIPRTIDNDLQTYTIHRCPDGREISVPLCPGYPSAALRLALHARRLRSTARSTHRIFTLETMGRDAGWLALATSRSWVELIMIPEVNWVSDPQKNKENKAGAQAQGQTLPQIEIPIERLYEKIEEWYTRNYPPHLIITVSEGDPFKRKTDEAYSIWRAKTWRSR